MTHRSDERIVKRENKHNIGKAVVNLNVWGKQYGHAWAPYLSAVVTTVGDKCKLSWTLFTEKSLYASPMLIVLWRKTPLPDETRKVILRTVDDILTQLGFVYDVYAKYYMYDRPIDEETNLEGVVDAVFERLDASLCNNVNIRRELSNWEGELRVTVEISAMVARGGGRFHGSVTTHIDLVTLMKNVGISKFTGEVDEVFNVWMVIVQLLPEEEGNALFNAVKRIHETGGMVYLKILDEEGDMK